MKRPFGVMVLVVLAGIAAVIAAVHTLQYLGIIPFFVGEIVGPVRGFSLFGAFMWALMVWIYVWLIQMLLKLDKQAWLFLAVIATFNLILNFVGMLGSLEWGDVAASTIVNGAILIYCMLPGVKSAFDAS